jgi:hypothetical protein
VLNEIFEGDADVLFEHACKLGCEGIVSKPLGSPCRSGRSAQNQKSGRARARGRGGLAALTKKKPRCRGGKKTVPRRYFLSANAGGAGIVARFFAVFFVHFFLLLAGLTGFVFRSLLLLLARLLPTAALLLLLVTLIRHFDYSLDLES